MRRLDRIKTYREMDGSIHLSNFTYEDVEYLLRVAEAAQLAMVDWPYWVRTLPRTKQLLNLLDEEES